MSDKVHDSALAFLLDESLKAVSAVYESHDGAPVEVFKSKIDGLEAGDLIAVQSGTRHEVTVCKVVDSDVVPTLDATTSYKWAIGKIEMEYHNHIVARENKAVDAIKERQRREHREKLQRTMSISDEDASLIAPPDQPFG